MRRLRTPLRRSRRSSLGDLSRAFEVIDLKCDDRSSEGGCESGSGCCPKEHVSPNEAEVDGKHGRQRARRDCDPPWDAELPAQSIPFRGATPGRHRPTGPDPTDRRIPCRPMARRRSRPPSVRPTAVTRPGAKVTSRPTGVMRNARSPVGSDTTGRLAFGTQHRGKQDGIVLEVTVPEELPVRPFVGVGADPRRKSVVGEQTIDRGARMLRGRPGRRRAARARRRRSGRRCRRPGWPTTGRRFHIASATVRPKPSARLFWTTTVACRWNALTIIAASSGSSIGTQARWMRARRRRGSARHAATHSSSTCAAFGVVGDAVRPRARRASDARPCDRSTCSANAAQHAVHVLDPSQRDELDHERRRRRRAAVRSGGCRRAGRSGRASRRAGGTSPARRRRRRRAARRTAGSRDVAPRRRALRSWRENGSIDGVITCSRSAVDPVGRELARG